MWVGVSAYAGQIGARAASWYGQGFHGAVRGSCHPPTACPPAGRLGTLERGFYPYSLRLASLNVMVYVRGSLVIPVELLEFEVE
jgi:hypothetical protein